VGGQKCHGQPWSRSSKGKCGLIYTQYQTERERMKIRNNNRATFGVLYEYKKREKGEPGVRELVDRIIKNTGE